MRSGAEPFRQYLALTRSGELLERLRPQIFAVLCLAFAGFMALSINHAQLGRWPQAIATGAFNLLLLVNAIAFWRQRPPPVPVWMLMVPALVSLALAAYTQGMDGLVWAYPAVLLFHFLAPRGAASVFNAATLGVAIPAAFTQLATPLAARYSAGLVLTVLFTNLFSYIAERQQRKEAEQARQLEAQNAQLFEAMRMREEVERIARHDLKTPLNSIASVPRLLRERRRLDTQEDELLVMVERSALRVLSMVNLSLDLYRMEEGTYRVRPQALDLVAVAHAVVRDVRNHAETKGLRISVRADSRQVLALGEELLAYTLLANLVKNALEASPDNAEVTLLVADDGHEWVTLAVHNDGAVPAKVRDRFFEKYATYGKAGGTGLGAYSARLMARMQHGDLQMRSSDTEGTTLTLRLPRLDDAQRAQFRADEAAEALPGTDAHALPPLKVLLVDDDEYNILVVRAMLPSPPLEVATAINGRAAIAAVREHAPDVILLDLEMPVMGGYAAAQRIREIERETGRRATIIAFSAHDDEATRRECEAAGFDSYLPKPASRAEILAALRAAAGQRASSPEGTDEDEIPAELLESFLQSRRELAAQLVAAIEAGDREHARRLAHKIAGGLAMYGFAAAGEQAAAIERATGEADAAALRSDALALQQALATPGRAS